METLLGHRLAASIDGTLTSKRVSIVGDKEKLFADAIWPNYLIKEVAAPFFFSFFVAVTNNQTTTMQKRLKSTTICNPTIARSHTRLEYLQLVSISQTGGTEKAIRVPDDRERVTLVRLMKRRMDFHCFSGTFELQRRLPHLSEPLP